MVRLSEALARSTIPVLIGLDIKLPLDDLIAWDELVIRLPVERISYLVPVLESIDADELARRQIKAKKIYDAYFATPTRQFQTLLAAVSHRIGLPPVGLEAYRADEFKFKPSRDVMDKNREENEEDEKYDGDEDEEGETEFVGESNQTPVDSPQFVRNYTQNSYAVWNQLFYPFNLFPSIPFESNSIPPRPFPIQEASTNNFYLNEYLKV